jgi:xanthine dehydrogenase accessory factor
LVRKAMVARIPRQIVIVIGSDEVGSAVAVLLRRAGLAVVVCDDVDPHGLRRGMTFADAWYVGTADVDGVTALFCSNLKSVPAVLDRERLVAATTWSWAGAAAALRPVAVVDARMRGPGGAADLRGRAPERCLTLGIGPGFVAGGNVDVAIPVTARERTRVDGAEEPAPPFAGDGPADRSATPDGVVRAPRNGRFATSRRIGEPVAAGEIVGWLGKTAVPAPRAGVLRGLAARGARVPEGAWIVEVDRRGDPRLCFGISEGALAAARNVVDALQGRDLLAPAVTELQSA